MAKCLEAFPDMQKLHHRAIFMQWCTTTIVRGSLPTKLPKFVKLLWEPISTAMYSSSLVQGIEQWYNRLIKIPKNQLFKLPYGPWSYSKYSLGGLASHCFYDAVDKSIVFPPNSSLRSAQETDTLTNASIPQGHHVLDEVKQRCMVHNQNSLSFAGSSAEPKVTSWSGTTLRQLFKGWLSVMWTFTFHVLFTTTDLVSCQSGVLLFLHH